MALNEFYGVARQIADPTSIAAEVTTELTREATAAGMTLAELMTMIALKSAAYDRAITTVAALEAECEARILAVDLAAPDYQQQLAVVAATNTGEIETARTSVSALIEGV
ncbi:hypothetical protein AB0T83_10960 [Fluviibacterium sp. DFM31]|uniref:Uncharacterized protein n=1 Tax=Meridianimarinicoccus marinus TaxID=3231483 RepID=A0ABV3L6U3_9RHOB